MPDRLARGPFQFPAKRAAWQPLAVPPGQSPLMKPSGICWGNKTPGKDNKSWGLQEETLGGGGGPLLEYKLVGRGGGEILCVRGKGEEVKSGM